MTEKLKLAFLGGGINSAIGKTHKIAISMDNNHQLVAGCFSRDSETNIQSAEAYNIRKNRVYNSLDSLIFNEKDNIDAICILTPTPNHKEDVIKSIRNGIPVICEKALAASVQEALEIKDCLTKHNGFLAVTYNYTGYPMLRELKDIITGNKLGKIEQVHIEMPQEGYAKHLEKIQNWRLHDKELPMISLDLGSHIYNIISFLTNEKPMEIISTENNFNTTKKVIDNSISIAKYTNGITCNIWFSKVALGHRNGLKVRIYGQEGSAQWYQADPENLHINDNKGNKYTIDRASKSAKTANKARYNRFKAGHPSGFIEAFANHYSDIFNLLQEKNGEKNNFVFGIKSALEGLKTIEAAQKSNTSKIWEKIH